MALLKPVITEKTMRLANAGQFTFAVTGQVIKSQVAAKVRDMFKVDVVRVNMINLPAKPRRTGTRRLTTPGSKRFKAIVTLKPGQTIAYFEPEKPKKKAPVAKAKGAK